MFENRSPGQPFPGIQTSDDIYGNRRWVLGILQDNSSTPAFQDFRNASYFQCPKERRPIYVDEFEAWQEIGATDLSDGEIKSFGMQLDFYYSMLLFNGGTKDVDIILVTQLWSNWRPENYEARLWNSQNFAVYLSILIIERGLRQENLQPLRDLHWTLWLKQDHKLGHWVLRRHLTSMAGMAVLGIATGGVGALASWAYGMYGLAEPAFASDKRVNGLRGLIHEFQALRNLLTSKDEEDD